MTHTVSYNLELSVIEVYVYGDFRFSEGREILQKTIDILKQSNCRHVVQDIRKANLKFSLVELFMVPKSIQDALTREGLSFQAHRWSVVANDYSSNLKFVENVVNNRGYTMKVFTDFDKALKWLQG